jgi:hypothetical protein
MDAEENGVDGSLREDRERIVQRCCLNHLRSRAFATINSLSQAVSIGLSSIRATSRPRNGAAKDHSHVSPHALLGGSTACDRPLPRRDRTSARSSHLLTRTSGSGAPTNAELRAVSRLPS